MQCTYLADDMPIEIHIHRRRRVVRGVLGDFVGLKVKLVGEELLFGYYGPACSTSWRWLARRLLLDHRPAYLVVTAGPPNTTETHDSRTKATTEGRIAIGTTGSEVRRI